MSDRPEILRYSAFADDPAGGNPAGVVLDAAALDDAEMQRIAAEVDYAETAFVTGRSGAVRTVRYFSPIAEVPFCGHATVATAIAIAEREGPGTVRFATPVGEIVIETTDDRRWPPCRLHERRHRPRALPRVRARRAARAPRRRPHAPRRAVSAPDGLRRQLASGGRDRGCRRLRRVRVRSRRRARVHRRAGLAHHHHGAASDRGCGRRRPAVRGPQPLPRGTHHGGPRDGIRGGGGRRVPPRARRGASARPRAHRAGSARRPAERAHRRHPRARRHRRERAARCRSADAVAVGGSSPAGRMPRRAARLGRGAATSARCRRRRRNANLGGEPCRPARSDAPAAPSR